MNEFDVKRRPAPTPADLEAGNYHLSSHDLRRGLEVRSVPLNAVDAELLHEFLRLRRLWAGGSAPLAR